MCKSPDNQSLSSLLPQEVSGWSAQEEDTFYNPETIFDYINGAGEVYRAYNFKTLLAKKYTKEGQPVIHADLFDMGASRNAFGVFTHDPEGEDVGIGQGSTYKGGLLSFWKGRFFASLFAEEETEEAKEALLSLGRRVALAVADEGEIPTIVSLLPQDNLVAKRVHYFFNPLILNFHYFVADENILQIGVKTDAVFAHYIVDDERFYLMLILYKDEEKSAAAYSRFVETYMPDAAEPGLVQTEDGKWTGIRMADELLILVFDAPSESAAQTLLGQVRRNI